MNVELILSSTYSTVSDARWRLNKLGNGYMIVRTTKGRWQIIKVGA
jgi:hypothetical protein